MNYIYIIAIPLVVYFVNTLIKYKNFLPSLSGEKHQLFVERKNIPLSGGVIIIITLLFIEKFNIDSFYLFLFSLFLIGFFSDLKIIKSPNFRLIFQFIVIATFVFYNQLEVINTRINFLDSLLEIMPIL